MIIIVKMGGEEMIDIHTHILPCIDDGAGSADVSLKMLKIQAEQGVKTVVFTPHYYGKKYSPERFLEVRKTAFEKIQKDAERLGLEFRMGAEIYFSAEKIASNRALCSLAIEGTKYVLIELPLQSVWSNALWNRLSDFICESGYTPIIAHVDRYAEIHKNPRYLSMLADMGCLLQVNTASFLQQKERKLVLRMLKKGLVHCLGTDSHNLSNRAPDYATAKAFFGEIGETARFEKIQENMQWILNGQIVTVGEYSPIKKFMGMYY
ncbi:MAG: hypothetical protein IJW58_03160 [Clostridia bacterium]|nr:hypothetical protein [Clostridia bacterium]